MQKIEIYCNYGVLAAEKRNVYTYGGEHQHATCSDRMTVIVPDEWKLYKNTFGATMVESPWANATRLTKYFRGTKSLVFMRSIKK